MHGFKGVGDDYLIYAGIPFAIALIFLFHISWKAFKNGKLWVPALLFVWCIVCITFFWKELNGDSQCASLCDKNGFYAHWFQHTTRSRISACFCYTEENSRRFDSVVPEKGGVKVPMPSWLF